MKTKKLTKTQASVVDLTKTPKPEETAVDKAVYNLPTSLGMALSTGREMFVDMYRNELKANYHTSSPVPVMFDEILRLLRDVLKDRRIYKEQLDVAMSGLEDLRDTFQAQQRTAAENLSEIAGVFGEIAGLEK